MSIQTLTDQLLNGHRRSLARLITYVENDHPDAAQALELLYPHTGQAHLIGITGAPGTGKSSLVNQLAKAYRRREQRVAVIPGSAFGLGGEGHVRCAYAAGARDIEEALERMYRFMRTHG